MAFIEYEEERDAEDAIKHWNLRDFHGTPLTVQVRSAHDLARTHPPSITTHGHVCDAPHSGEPGPRPGF